MILQLLIAIGKCKNRKRLQNKYCTKEEGRNNINIKEHKNTNAAMHIEQINKQRSHINS